MTKTHILTMIPLTLGLACASSNDAKTPETAKSTAAASKPAEAPPPTTMKDVPSTTEMAMAAEPPARKDDADRKSKNGKVEAEIGGAKVMVQYGRPAARGRVVFGDLVAYGKLWRTGADEATTITFDQDVTVEGKPLKKGTYALFTLPTADKWTVVFNSEPKQWGAYKYDESKDVLRVDVAPKKMEEMVEIFTIEATGEQLVLKWEKTMVGVTIAAAG